MRLSAFSVTIILLIVTIGLFLVGLQIVSTVDVLLDNREDSSIRTVELSGATDIELYNRS